MSKNYSHPNWQKKRLEILSRDSFMCTSCGEDQETLHVHHRYYIKGNEIWDYHNSSLTTLCQECHVITHDRTNDEDSEEQYKSKYAMLDMNLDYSEIAPALLLYGATRSPKDAKVLSDYLWIIANTFAYDKDFLNKFFESTAKLLPNEECIVNSKCFPKDLKDSFLKGRKNG